MTEIADPENTIIMETTKGKVVIQLMPDVAPNHVARIKELSREGFYDNIVFHRVIDDFMAQTGDPTGTGRGGSDKPDLQAEFSDVSHVRGTCSMARSQNPHSGNSQFFICFAESPWLNRQYSVWGQVIEGMEAIDQIKRGEPVRDPDSIVTMRVAADGDTAPVPAEEPVEEEPEVVEEAPAEESHDGGDTEASDGSDAGEEQSGEDPYRDS